MEETENWLGSDSQQGFAERFAEFHGFEICQEPWGLYYDETENCRSVSYGDGKIKDARAIERDFILGGIVVTDPDTTADLIEGTTALPSPSGEIKSKPVLGGSSDFWRTLKRKETTTFLELIDRAGVAVHYHAQDNLYYSIVDIVDSAIGLPGHEHMGMLHRELKNALYCCASQNPVGFLNGLVRFGYPNVGPDEIQPFCCYIADLLALMLKEYPRLAGSQIGFFVETLRQMMKTASRASSLIFLEGNEEGVLVEGFSAHYQTTCMLLPNATHHFDDETHISMDLVANMDNYEFLKSEDNPLIQLSDVWVGLLSRLFHFLDEWVERPTALDSWSTESRQMENLKTIKRLIDRADSLHRSLLSNCNANEVILKRG